MRDDLRLKVLIGMEYSGRTRDAFRKLGHDAYSCDFLPADDGLTDYHYQDDVFRVLEADQWDLAVFHPTCTFLTCSAEWAYKEGPYHMKLKPETLVGAERRSAREKAIMVVKDLMASKPKHKGLENPRGILSTRYRKPDQIIQPNWFGDDASKATCLWLEELPLLVETDRIKGRLVEWPRGSGKMVERWANQTDSGQNRLPPSADRWKIRSETYPGISEAFAVQWGQYVISSRVPSAVFK